MVAQTRSSIAKKHNNNNNNGVVANNGDSDGDHHLRRSSRRRVKIVTPSLREASIHPYKVYVPNTTTTRRKSAAVAGAVAGAVAAECCDDDLSYIADAIMELNGKDARKNTVTTKHLCINPMTPITQYVYGIHVYNIAKTQHYKSAYILYDNTSRLYTVYSIVSNVMLGQNSHDDDKVDSVPSLPHPVHTVHTKYTTFISDVVLNYIMTMIVPSNNYDYFIQDEIIGILASSKELSETAFGPDSSYYDIAQLILEDHSSLETTNGRKAFHLIPPREYWFDPANSGESYRGLSFSNAIVNCVLMIVSQSQ